MSIRILNRCFDGKKIVNLVIIHHIIDKVSYQILRQH